MAFQPAAPGVVEIVAKQLVYGFNVVNVFHAQFGGGVAPSITTMGTLAAALLGWYNTQLYPVLSQNAQFQSIQVTDISSETGAQVIQLPSDPIIGGQTGAALVTQAAMVIQFRSTYRGRSYRGRYYLAGLEASAAPGSVFTSGSVGSIQTIFAALAEVMGEPGATHVVLSRRTGGALRPTALGTTVEQYAPQSGVANQRRRSSIRIPAYD